MDPEEILLETEESMEKALEYAVNEFAAVRTGKASPALVENLDVEAYGSVMKLKQLALISTPEPRMIVIQPFDSGTTKDIERAIRESKVGITPVSDGKLLRLPIPPLTEERRRDLVKSVKQMSEEAKVRIRSARRDGMEGLKKLAKEGGYTEDSIEGFEKEVQKLTDGFVKKIEDSTALKEADIMKV